MPFRHLTLVLLQLFNGCVVSQTFNVCRTCRKKQKRISHLSNASFWMQRWVSSKTISVLQVCIFDAIFCYNNIVSPNWRVHIMHFYCCRRDFRARERSVHVLYTLLLILYDNGECIVCTRIYPVGTYLFIG